MLQALVKRGRVLPEEIPAPIASSGNILVKVVHSCISAGTEMSGVNASRVPLIKKALQQPDKVAKALNMIRTEGIGKTIDKIKGKLEAGSATGYSAAGVVIAVGEGVSVFRPGDRVAAAGAGIANHAEFIDVPENLATKIPENVDFREASTVALGAVAMQGVRRAAIQLGEIVIIFGMGILGQITLQLAKAVGARCIAVDLDERRLEIAKTLSAELTINPSQADLQKNIHHLTDGYGADAVIFTAATDSPTALSQAFSVTRRKGRVIMVGVYGKELNRDDIYKKEIDFLISTSYGPGRYDDTYETKGIDYPYAYVRWTENRNMQEYLRLLSSRSVNLESIIEASFPIAEAEKAFEALNQARKPLIVLLDYGLPERDFAGLGKPINKVEINAAKPSPDGKIRIGILGAGSFTTGVHLPNLKKLAEKFSLQGICNRTGVSASAVAGQYGAKYATTNPKDILDDPEVDLVMVCTRHDTHANLTLQALKAGKHVFVEKPLAITEAELDKIKNFYTNTPGAKPILIVGFNRRFSRYAQEAKKHTSKRINPLFMHYRMNAGYLPMDHWVHGTQGGGRIIGEGCHIIDLFNFFTERRICKISQSGLFPKTESLSSSDNKVITLEYEDGSVATLEYFAVGSKELAKESLEIHFDEKSIVIDDYKSITGHGVNVAQIKSSNSEKGHLEELQTVAQCLNARSLQWPIELWDILQTTETALICQNGKA